MAESGLRCAIKGHRLSSALTRDRAEYAERSAALLQEPRLRRLKKEDGLRKIDIEERVEPLAILFELVLKAIERRRDDQMIDLSKRAKGLIKSRIEARWLRQIAARGDHIFCAADLEIRDRA